MQRLLQGDVGSGKTVVAALAALQAIESGRQVAFMAPTEILAEQHYRKLAQWLDGLGVTIVVALGLAGREGQARGARGARERRRAVRRRHARALPGGCRDAALGLVIVDEQHRFGVAQRLALRGKGARRGAPADDERDADPAHAGDDVLRRPRRVGAGRAAAGPHAGGDAPREPEAPRRDRRVGRQGVSPRAGRCTGCVR